MNINLRRVDHITSRPSYQWYDDLMRIRGANWNFFVLYEVSKKISHDWAIYRIYEIIDKKLNEKTFEH